MAVASGQDGTERHEAGTNGGGVDVSVAVAKAEDVEIVGVAPAGHAGWGRPEVGDHFKSQSILALAEFVTRGGLGIAP